MIEVNDKRDCSGCTACASICPVKCIEMKSDEEGFVYPVVDKSRCINCGLCEKTCPIINRKADAKIEPRAYACINNNLAVRMNSSSGGVFSLLAEYILQNDGVVFGASFDEKFVVRHTFVEREEDLNKLRVSKYVQSDMGEMFKKAKEFLDADRKVLFTGTACQIAGLKSFLKRDYENLFTQDLICHGVPSPLVWKKYLELKGFEDCESISFRKKLENKKRGVFYAKFKNGEEYVKSPYPSEPMTRIFLLNKCLRPSCHACVFKTITRQSDVTLADFWGINSVLPEINDKKGVSLVLIQSEKGQKLFDEIKSGMTYKEVNFKHAIIHNKMYYKSALKNPVRTRFFRDLQNLPFKKVMGRYGWGLL